MANVFSVDTASKATVKLKVEKVTYLGTVYDQDGKYLGDGELTEKNAFVVDQKVFTDNTSEGKTKWDIVLSDVSKKALGDNDELIRLASCAYGEGSTDDVFEEMAGIASVIVRQVEARSTTIPKLLKTGGSYAFASSGKCERFNTMMKLKPLKRNKKTGMLIAIKAAINALTQGTDYSGTAYFWDGLDIKTNYAKHAKIIKGFHITSEDHNVHNIKSSTVDVTTYWLDANHKPTAKVRGKYTYTYESTAGEGGTIFSKFSSDYLKAEGGHNYE